MKPHLIRSLCFSINKFSSSEQNLLGCVHAEGMNNEKPRTKVDASLSEENDSNTLT